MVAGASTARVAEEKNMENAANRKFLASTLSMKTIPTIFLSDVVLLIILNFHEDYKTYKNIIFMKEETIRLLYCLILPAGVLSFMSSLCIHASKLKMKNYVGLGMSVTLCIECVVGDIFNVPAVSGKFLRALKFKDKLF